MVQNRILVIGAGSHCLKSHLKPLRALGVEPYAFFDPGLTKAPSEYEQVTLLEDLHLAAAEADAVIIASPDRFHFSQMQVAIEQGCHIFCEKPLAATKQEADQLHDLFEEGHRRGLTITTCHPRRFDPPYIAVRNAIEDLTSRYGDVIHVELDFSYHRPSKSGLHGGSMLQDHANHEIDYLCWLLGETGFKALLLTDQEDRYALSGVRQDNVTFLFQGTRRLNAKIYPETIQIRFEQASLFVDTFRSENTHIFEHESRQRLPFAAGPTDYDKRFLDLNKHWLNVMSGKVDNYISDAQMLCNTQLSVAFQTQQTFTYHPSDGQQ